MKFLSKPIDQPGWLARELVPALLCATALLGGCSSGGTPPVREASRVEVSASHATGYRVVAGDTLYSIAWRHQRDFRELAALNRIRAPYSIYPGQLLTIRGQVPAARVAATPNRNRQRSTASKARTAPKRAAAGSKSAPHPLATTRTKPQSGNGIGVSSRTTTSPATKRPASTAATAQPPKQIAATASSSKASSTTRPAVPGSRQSALNSSGPVRFRWPGSGKRVKTFGSKTSDSAGPSSSIEFLLAAGAPIRAASSGEVVFAGKGLAGYQQFVILKHNDTWLSAYGFNARSNVSEGQRVAAGSTLAVVPAGAQRVVGAADQTRRLYFEVRKNGKPVNPDGVISKTGSG